MSKENGTESGAAEEAVTMDLGLAPIKEEEFNGRVYHEEHFAHGVLLAQLAEGNGMNGYVNGTVVQNGTADGRMNQNGGEAVSRKGTGTLEIQRVSTALNAGGVVPAPSVALGAPMPKWPAGHQSAAFESVSMKKSFILSPAEIYAECAHHGEEKSKYPWYKIWILSMIAGCYVGFGYTTCLLIGGNLSFAPGIGSEEDTNYGLYKLIFGAVGFPFGFTTIVVCGAELYTSLCAYMTAAWWEGKVNALTVLRMLAISWIGNFMGCLIMAGLFRASDIYRHKDTTLHLVAADKLSHPWGVVLVKGIFANWLVGIATWMANAAQDLTGKAVGIWLPISAFAMIGFEHCIANQFLFPMAAFMGYPLTFKDFIGRNLIPSTIGNYIGGGVCLATVYAFAYGRTPKRISDWFNDKVKKSL